MTSAGGLWLEKFLQTSSWSSQYSQLRQLLNEWFSINSLCIMSKFLLFISSPTYKILNSPSVAYGGATAMNRVSTAANTIVLTHIALSGAALSASA